MLSLPSSIPTPLLTEQTVARSRSRYKGPHKIRTNTSDSSSLRGEQLQRFHNILLPPCESKPESNGGDRRVLQIKPRGHEALKRFWASADDDGQISAVSVAQDRRNPRQAENSTHLQNELMPSTQTMQDYQLGYQLERNAMAEPRKQASQDSLPRQKKTAASSKSCSQHSRPQLHLPHIRGAAMTVESPALLVHRRTPRDTRHLSGNCIHKDMKELKSGLTTPIPVESAPDVAKPAFDAPVSAVNAGERRVKVKLKQSLILIPVTPSTTPSAIIRSAADQLAESIDLNSVVLFESFKLLGLERPLRSYEHIRDVLNSWNHDTHNTLIIKPSPSGSRDERLDISPFSDPQPVDTSIFIHYSQRPGRWDERWVTLRSDGQMLVAKREGGEASNICHMSDFDIYNPTTRQLTKRIKPPRKICFAVKSQQKSSMFLSTANFVHFFSTSDRTLASTWYAAVRKWRSWYLVNVMGEGEEGEEVSEKCKSDIRKLPEGIDSIRVPKLEKSHAKHVDPLTNPNHGQIVVEDILEDTMCRSRKKLYLWQSKMLSEDDNLSSSREQSSPTVPQEIEPFAATGLLGRTYTQRQKAQREREKAQEARLDQREATRNGSLVIQLERAQQRPKPLIDLTPHFQEPPQHAKRGRGVTLEQIPVGGLVEVANTPDAAIPIPPSSSWCRHASNAGLRSIVEYRKSVRRDLSKGTPSELKETLGPLKEKSLIFTGGPLASLSKDRHGAGTAIGFKIEPGEAGESSRGLAKQRQFATVIPVERAER